MGTAPSRMLPSGQRSGHRRVRPLSRTSGRALAPELDRTFGIAPTGPKRGSAIQARRSAASRRLAVDACEKAPACEAEACGGGVSWNAAFSVRARPTRRHGTHCPAILEAAEWAMPSRGEGPAAMPIEDLRVSPRESIDYAGWKSRPRRVVPVEGFVDLGSWHASTHLTMRDEAETRSRDAFRHDARMPPARGAAAYPHRMEDVAVVVDGDDSE